MTCIIYTRVSSSEQTDGTSLATQLADCRAYAKKQGYVVKKTFEDAGESAKTADRPGLIAAIQYVKKNKPDRLIVWKLDRLTRNTTDGLTIRATLRCDNCEIESATESITTDPAGELLMTLLMGVAQFDNDVRRDRCKRSQLDILQRGGYITKAPAFFANGRAQDGLPILIPDPAKKDAIAKAITDYAHNITDRTQLLQSLRDTGFIRQQASRIHDHPIYGGVIRTKRLPNDIHAAFPCFVTPDVWYLFESRSRRETRYFVRHKTNPDFYLGNLVYCEKCGRSITGYHAKGRHGGKYPYYKCPCNATSIRAEKLHAQIHTMLQRSSLAAQTIENTRKDVLLQIGEATQHLDREKQVAQNEIARIERAKRKLVDAYCEDLIEESLYRTKLLDYNTRLTNLRATSSDTIDKLDRLINITNQLLDLLHDPAALFERLNTELKKQMLLAFFGKMRLNDAAIEPLEKTALSMLCAEKSAKKQAGTS